VAFARGQERGNLSSRGAGSSSPASPQNRSNVDTKDHEGGVVDYKIANHQATLTSREDL
jgi:hypothetical protein